MKTQCNADRYLFEGLGGREAVASFDGGYVTSDAGLMLVHDVDQLLGLTKGFAAAFTDHRNPDLIEHTVTELVAQRVYGLVLGYEDLNDHDDLRHDPLLAAACGKKDATGEHRRREQDRGKALAAKNTFSRLELTEEGATKKERYKKVELREAAADDFLVEMYAASQDIEPALITLDIDASDTQLHGQQEGRFYHGYYGGYCYMPLYVFAGEHLLLARLRTADRDGAHGVVEELGRLVARLRSRWPKVKILVRGDSGFCREALMAWCEQNGHFFVLGLARNGRLEAEVESELARAEQLSKKENRARRVYRDFRWSTVKSWSRKRRVVAKAEHLPGNKANPRFIVTNLPKRSWSALRLYEELYCARGEAENRIKEQQLGLFGDCMPTPTIRGNQIRLYFSAVAYVLVVALRQHALAGTDLARAQASTIRTKLLKIGAVVRVTVRRIWISMSSACPWQDVFAAAHRNLRALAAPRL